MATQGHPSNASTARTTVPSAISMAPERPLTGYALQASMRPHHGPHNSGEHKHMREEMYRASVHELPDYGFPEYRGGPRIGARGGTRRRHSKGTFPHQPSANTMKGTPVPLLPFNVRGPKKDVGGRVTRVYEVQSNYGNSAALASGVYFGYSIRNTVAGAGAVPSLNIYYGRADNATAAPILAFTDFPAEAISLCNVFKWMNVDKIEVTAFPMLQSTATSTNAAAMPNSLDGGIVWLGGHTGDERFYAVATGVPTSDTLNMERLPHENLVAIGLRSKTVAKQPQTSFLEESNTGSVKTSYPVSFPIATNVFINNITEYPMYGHWYYWYHPNLVAAANLVKIILKFRIQISWNTIQDQAISLAVEQKEEVRKEDLAKSLAGTLMPGTTDQYYPKDWTKVFSDPLKPEEESQPIEDYIPVQKNPTPPVIKVGSLGSRPSTPNIRR